MYSSSADVPTPPATGLEVRPFRALTYRRRDPEHLARVTSPAYDLVTPAGRENLAAADPHNIVRLILPRVEPAAVIERGKTEAFDGEAVDGEAGDPVLRSAGQAAATLRSWEQDGTLARDADPALWLYELQPVSRPATRGWLGAVTLPSSGSRAVLPHEDTYPRAVEGRRALLAATRTDLEPIVLAHDHEPSLAPVEKAVRDAEPDLLVEDADGVRHRLWRVTEPAVLSAVTAALGRTEAVIADGHHRFAAAQAHHRERPDAAGSGAVLALLTPMGPGGLRVEAIHRVVPDLGLDRAVAAAATGFRVDDVTPDGGADQASAVRAVIETWLQSPAGSGLLVTDGRRVARLSEPGEQVRGTVPPEAPAAWRRLDVVLAHHGLFEHLWGRTDDPASVLVAHDVDAALRGAAERDGVAVLLRAPSPSDVAAVARAGARMPRKSTLFVPKPRTGLVLRPHDG